MITQKTRAGFVLGAVLFLASPIAFSQTKPLASYDIAARVYSGSIKNPSGETKLVFDAVVEGGAVPWMRLHFDRVDLPEGSYLVVSSLFDGAVQMLDGTALAQWHYTSAYFNGDTIRLQLFAGPFTDRNVVQVSRLTIGEWEPDIHPATQCGSGDDRVSSDLPERARVFPVGCTASLISTTNCFITAGHCMTPDADIIEFNVPPSLPGGTVQHPGPEDQYVIDLFGAVFSSKGKGNDWGLFRALDNTQTGLSTFEAQGANLVLATALPPAPLELDIVGFGVDVDEQSQTQQISSGPLVRSIALRNRHVFTYQIDTEGGNSGSVVTLKTGEIVGIHTNGGCASDGSGANSGTVITQPALQAALLTFCQ